MKRRTNLFKEENLDIIVYGGEKYINIVNEIINKDIQEEVLTFFNNLGIVPKIKNGYFYPFSNQATTIKNALLNEVTNKGIIVRNEFFVNSPLFLLTLTLRQMI